METVGHLNLCVLCGTIPSNAKVLESPLLDSDGHDLAWKMSDTKEMMPNVTEGRTLFKIH